MAGNPQLLKEIYSIGEITSVAQKVLDFVKDNNMVTFEGEMGAGKTTLIKAICKIAGVKANVSSPTFSLINEYLTKDGKTLYHFDFYRINSEIEAFDIGYEEYFYSGNMCFVEWPSKIQSLLPVPRIRITLVLKDDASREITLEKICN